MRHARPCRRKRQTFEQTRRIADHSTRAGRLAGRAGAELQHDVGRDIPGAGGNRLIVDEELFTLHRIAAETPCAPMASMSSGCTAPQIHSGSRWRTIFDQRFSSLRVVAGLADVADQIGRDRSNVVSQVDIFGKSLNDAIGL